MLQFFKNLKSTIYLGKYYHFWAYLFGYYALYSYCSRICSKRN